MGMFDNITIEDLKKKLASYDDKDKEKLVQALGVKIPNDSDMMQTIIEMQKSIKELEASKKTSTKKSSSWGILFGEDD